MTKKEVVEQVLKNLDIIKDQEAPNIELIQETIDLVENNGLGLEMMPGLLMLKMLKESAIAISKDQDPEKASAAKVGMSIEDILKMAKLGKKAKVATQGDQPNEEPVPEEQCDCGNCIELEPGEEAKLQFSVTRTNEGLVVRFNSAGFSELELLGAVELLREQGAEQMNK